MTDQPTPRRRRRNAKDEPSPDVEDDEDDDSKRPTRAVPTRRDPYGRARLDPQVIDDLEARHQWDARLWRP